MLKKSLLGLGVAEATKTRSPPVKPSAPEGSIRTDKQMVETGQTYTDSQCFPGVSKMYSTLDEALNSWSGSGVYTDPTFTGWDALFYYW